MLSVIIPAYNEEKMIPKTAEVIAGLLEAEKIDYEILFINDGSRDHTWEKICEAGAANPKVKGFCFARNFGKEAAMFAGLEKAKATVRLSLTAICSIHRKKSWRCITSGKRGTM